MVDLRRVVFASLVLAACGTGSGTTIANRPAAAKETIGQMLEREVGAGAPVAIVAGKKGVRAVSADGVRQRVLAPGPALWTLVDQRSHLVWFGTDVTTVHAIDLDAPAATGPTDVKIADGLPETSGAGAPLVAIRYASKEEMPYGDLQFGGRLQPRVVIVMGPEPALGVAGGILDMWSQTEEFAAAVKKARIVVDRGWLARVAERGRDGSFMLLDSTSGEQRVDGVDKSACQDPERCGYAEPLPKTKLWRVAVAFACGDGCYTEWRLYDPTAKRYPEVIWTNTLSDAWVARDGSAFVQAGVISRFDSGNSLTETPTNDGSGGGWLGGAYYLH